ncbi:MAG: serine/threonine protein kinase [Clostridia bacterium]|nr:serine/threonine protein kinase [Clostridia bacterium]
MKNGTVKVMTREQYLTDIFKAYSLVSVLSDKNECKVLKLKNKELNKYIVVRSFPKSISAYEELYSINCANLPLIYDIINLDDGQIVLEEFIEGVTIAEVMEGGKYRYTGTRKVLRSICNALTVLHERGIVHRDIKPENVMIAKDGRVVLIDFNAARQISNASKDTVIMGTVGYASPEQLGVTQSDARTDIYALGVLLNVMITGKHPSEKLAKGKAGRIVRKCTSVNPDERYQTAEKLAHVL